VLAQHFSRRGDFEPLGHGFARFAASDRLGHEARNVVGLRVLTTTLRFSP
jgi:hypothetical protein